MWAGRQYVVDYLLLAALIAALCASEVMDPFERSVYHKTDAVGRMHGFLSSFQCSSVYSSSVELLIGAFTPHMQRQL